MRGEPRVDRPTPYWNIAMPAPLPWSWAVERLERARNYWIVLQRTSGHPYARPVWGVWLDGALHFDSSSMDANLRAGGGVEVHLESGDEVVILAGTASAVTDRARLERMAVAINAKYRWDWTPEGFPAPYVLRPLRAYGWCSDPTGADRGALFGETGTRWTFG